MVRDRTSITAQTAAIIRATLDTRSCSLKGVGTWIPCPLSLHLHDLVAVEGIPCASLVLSIYSSLQEDPYL